RSISSRRVTAGSKRFATPRSSSMPALEPGDDAERGPSQGGDAGAGEQPALLREDGDRGERDGDLQERHRDRELLVRMQRVLAFLVGRLRFGLERLGLLLDVFLLDFVALHVRREFLARDRIGREPRGELREVLLRALRLVVVPHVRGLGLLAHRLALVEERLVLRVPPEEAHDRPYRGEKGREDGDLLAEAALVRFMLDR